MKYFTYIFSGFVALVISTVSIMLYAMVVHILWMWYLIPAGAPKITFATAAGIVFVGHLIAGKSLPSLKEEMYRYSAYVRLLMSAFVDPALILLIGFIVRIMFF